MVTSGGQPSGAGDPRIRPSRRWYWVAGGVLAGGVKLALEVLLSHLHIAEGHRDIFMPQQLHKGR